MNNITKIKVADESESSYQLYPRNEEFAKRSGGGAGNSGVQPDWNQNDATKPDYVKNRPFYTNNFLEMPMEETTVEFATNGAVYVSTGSYYPLLALEETYQVTWDGTTYECTCHELERELVFGNLYMIGAGENTGEPFFYGMGYFYTPDNSASHTISIWRTEEVNVKIEEKYIPKLQYMDKANPTCTGSFSLNRKVGTIVADGSFAEGIDTTASGWCSHAEGNKTTASFDAAHAEGSGTIASRESSHAEGDCTTASGRISHAEGWWTTASGESSHVEGHGTKASSAVQHVQGEYNIEDSSGTYAHIVGNGTADDARSNAHTLDWSGNAWFAGTIEGKAIILPSSTEGSAKRFKITVDDSGTLTAELIPL